MKNCAARRRSAPTRILIGAIARRKPSCIAITEYRHIGADSDRASTSVTVIARLDRARQYPEAIVIDRGGRGVLDPSMRGDDSRSCGALHIPCHNCNFKDALQ